jgi:hypothetical protein
MVRLEIMRFSLIALPPTPVTIAYHYRVMKPIDMYLLKFLTPLIGMIATPRNKCIAMMPSIEAIECSNSLLFSADDPIFIQILASEWYRKVIGFDL